MLQGLPVTRWACKNRRWHGSGARSGLCSRRTRSSPSVCISRTMSSRALASSLRVHWILSFYCSQSCKGRWFQPLSQRRLGHLLHLQQLHAIQAGLRKLLGHLQATRVQCGMYSVLTITVHVSDDSGSIPVSTICRLQTWTQATTYLQLIGILLGQLTFGFLGDAIGRRLVLLKNPLLYILNKKCVHTTKRIFWCRNTMLIDMTIVLVGVILLTANTASTYYNWVIFYAISQLIFGFGIGGECAPSSLPALALLFYDCASQMH